MTSSNGNIFHVTGHLCGEFTGHRWIPPTKSSDAELWYFIWSAPEQAIEQVFEQDLRRRRAHNDVPASQMFSWNTSRKHIDKHWNTLTNILQTTILSLSFLWTFLIKWKIVKTCSQLSNRQFSIGLGNDLAPQLWFMKWVDKVESSFWRRLRFVNLLNEYYDLLQWRHNELDGVSNHRRHNCFVNSTICSGEDQRRHQSSASLAFARGIHRWPVNSPHKGPVTRKRFPFDDVIIFFCITGLMWGEP